MGTVEVVEIHTMGQGLWNLYTVLNGLKFKVPQCMGCKIFEYMDISNKTYHIQKDILSTFFLNKKNSLSIINPSTWNLRTTHSAKPNILPLNRNFSLYLPIYKVFTPPSHRFRWKENHRHGWYPFRHLLVSPEARLRTWNIFTCGLTRKHVTHTWND